MNRPESLNSRDATPENSIAVFFQCFRNRKAVDYCLQEFRRFHPDAPIRLISDAGDDFSDMADKYGTIFIRESTNCAPGAKLGGVSQTFEWLRRLSDACETFNAKWILLMEEDVLTRSEINRFPATDSAGVCTRPYHPKLDEYVRSRNMSQQKLGVGLCGGSVFSRTAFLDCYAHVNQFEAQLPAMIKLEKYMGTSRDYILNTLFYLNNRTYSEWDELTENCPEYSQRPDAALLHNFKNFYDPA